MFSVVRLTLTEAMRNNSIGRGEDKKGQLQQDQDRRGEDKKGQLQQYQDRRGEDKKGQLQLGPENEDKLVEFKDMSGMGRNRKI